jgi:hypothetical protein
VKVGSRAGQRTMAPDVLSLSNNGLLDEDEDEENDPDFTPAHPPNPAPVPTVRSRTRRGVAVKHTRRMAPLGFARANAHARTLTRVGDALMQAASSRFPPRVAAVTAAAAAGKRAATAHRARPAPAAASTASPARTTAIVTSRTAAAMVSPRATTTASSNGKRARSAPASPVPTPAGTHSWHRRTTPCRTPRPLHPSAAPPLAGKSRQTVRVAAPNNSNMLTVRRHARAY